MIGDYATSIVEAIGKCKIFVLVLNENSSNSNHCLNEVEIAYKVNMENQNTITIMPFRVDNRNLSKAMEYYIKRLHWIDAANCSLEKAIDELLQKIMAVLKIESPAAKERARQSNKYFSWEDAAEVKRLQTQQNLSKCFDSELYESLISGRENLTVLDAGSNNGDLIMDRLGSRKNVAKIVGLECNEECVAYANAKYKETGKAEFYVCDLEADDFCRQMDEIARKTGIAKFDIIHISMLLLHLKNPFKVLKNLRKYCSPHARIYIKDIDDGQNFAFPDADNTFERVYSICAIDELAGYRKSGRQIYTYLTNSGFKNIQLAKSGLNTIGMDYECRQALFDTYFSFIVEDLKVMRDKYPTNQNIADNLEWYADIYDDLEEKFHSPNFIFSLGFMIYTAEY